MGINEVLGQLIDDGDENGFVDTLLELTAEEKKDLDILNISQQLLFSPTFTDYGKIVFAKEFDEELYQIIENKIIMNPSYADFDAIIEVIKNNKEYRYFLMKEICLRTFARPYIRKFKELLEEGYGEEFFEEVKEKKDMAIMVHSAVFLDKEDLFFKNDFLLAMTIVNCPPNALNNKKEYLFQLAKKSDEELVLNYIRAYLPGVIEEEENRKKEILSDNLPDFFPFMTYEETSIENEVEKSLKEFEEIIRKGK